MLLREALNIQRGEVVAFTGAGGKTSSLIRLGHELLKDGWRVIGATTTRIAIEELGLIPGAVNISGTSLRPAAISRALSQHGFIFLYRDVQNGKVIGLEPALISDLMDAVDSDVTLVEADGARRLPFKAPLPHEPVIPESATLCVPVAGVDVVGMPFDEDHVYNPQAMSAQYGYLFGEKVRYPWVASVLRDRELGLRNVPDQARVIALLNKVPRGATGRNIARLIARLVLREHRIEAVALGAVQNDSPVMEVHRRIGAVVLAAGMSRRMNQPDTSKVLLPWDGRPIIRVIADRLKRMRLDDILVVTGHLGAKVRAALENEPVRFVNNPDYREGDMLSSLQVGIRSLGPQASACLIVLGDQPQLDNKVVAQVIGAYYEGQGKIVAPSYRGRRGHPILIDRIFWQELLDLPRGAAPRDVINAHSGEIAYINVDSDSILNDIDTPDDYRDARRRAGLS